MASAVSLAPWYPVSVCDEPSPFTMSFADLRQPEQRRRLSRVLSCNLSEPANPCLSWLNRVELRESRALLRFEPGLGTLEQRAQVGARGACRLPLPFLWSLRAINAAAAAGLPPGLREFSGHAVLTIGGGEARLNAALVECAPEAESRVALVPQCLVRTFAACIGAADPARPLAIHRPLLPSSVLRTVAELPARARAVTCFQAEREALRALEQRLQGHFFVAPETTPCSAGDLVRRQLGLLGALCKLEGTAAVDAYFASNLERFGAQAEFRAALGAWRGEGKLLPCDAPSRARQEAEWKREAATEARIAQARLEFRRRKRTVGLAFAIDAVCAAPEAPEAWLVLGAMREPEARSSAPLCFSEAICAARGKPETIAQVQGLLRLTSEAQLAAYFREHGDFALARWLDPGNARVSPSPLVSH